MPRKLFGFLFLLFAFISCQKERYDVPPEVDVWVQKFIEEGEARGLDLDIKRLRIRLRDNLMSNGNDVAGKCLNRGGRRPEIELDGTFSQLTPEIQEQLVFHELGHCILDRGHSDALLENGHFASIMNTSFWSYIEGQQFKRSYYLDELFAGFIENQPAWITPFANFSDVEDSDRQTLFNDPFTSNNQNWNLINSDGHSMQITGGELTMTSNCNEGLASLRSVNLPAGDNFELTARIQVVQDRDLTNAIVLGIDGVFSILGINLKNEVTLGELEPDNNLITLTAPNTTASAWNDITIRRIDDTLFYFINDQFQDYRVVDSKAVTSFGFLLGSCAQIKVDQIQVFKLNL